MAAGDRLQAGIFQGRNGLQLNRKDCPGERKLRNQAWRNFPKRTDQIRQHSSRLLDRPPVQSPEIFASDKLYADPDIVAA